MDRSAQTDIIFIDFRKAFDTVPHCRLLNKIYDYGIRGRIHDWIKTWLTQRVQRVVVNGHASNFTQVKSGVPQGTVLGSLMFLLYINDISYGISSQLRLFADDCILYRVINNEQDKLLLQNDLDLILKWTETWQMKLNNSKCVVLTCSRLVSTIITDYTIGDNNLHRVNQHHYLGILFDSKMSFSPHISNAVTKATRTLNFIRRNLFKCSPQTKSLAYTSLVRPLLEYGAAVWDPYLQKDIHNIEMVQRRAARWVNSDYRHNSSVSSMLTNLQWPSLEHRRQCTRLKLFYNIVHQASVLKLPNYFSTTTYPTRHHHHLHFEIPFTRCNNYKYSFYPRTLRDWNNLPIMTIESETVEQFLDKL